MANVVELVDVSKVYDPEAARPALDEVSIDVHSGEFTAVMGPSGSGKSTLLNLVAGLDRPSSGAVNVGGEDLGRLDEAALARFRRSKVGFIFQFFNLLPSLTVLGNVLIPAELNGVNRREAYDRAKGMLERLGIGDVAGRYPARLSGGQQQRVAIARALMNDPDVLLADEPTGALDTRSGDQVMELIAELNGGGQTVILVTHDPKLAARHAGRIVTLVDGRITDDVRLQAASPDPHSVVGVRVREQGR